MKPAHALLVRMKFAVVGLGLLLVTVSSAWAQPTATTTFTGATDTAWTDASNWDTGLPDAADDAWIGDGKTAVVTSAYLDANPFGTLTLGTNSTLQLSAASNTGLPGSSTIYFNNGSHLQLTAGTINRSASYNLVSGASATFTVGSNTIPQGTLTGASNTTFNIIQSGDVHWRLGLNAFAGSLNVSSNNSSARLFNITAFGTAPLLGAGTTTFNNNVRAALQQSNRISDSGTVKLVGGAGGGSNIKFVGSTDKSDTIANLIIDSPIASTGAYIRMRNGFLKATSGVTFQGTAGTVRIDNELGGASSFKAGVDAQGANVVFGGTGDWVITGSGQLKTSASTTITTNTNATISNYLQGTTSFTKNGNGRLTLNGPLDDFTGTINVTQGELAVAGSVKGITMSTSTQLTIGTAGSAADTLTLGTSGLSLASGSSTTINWQYNGVTTAGADYDTIVSSTTLDLTGRSITINGTSLGYAAQVGDSFTLFNGTVTGFDANNFTLNMPTLANGTWAIQEGSLVLTVIPEAGSTLLGALGVVGLLLRRRRH